MGSLAILIIVAAGAGYLASSSHTVTLIVTATAPIVTTTMQPVTTTVYTNFENTFFSSSCSISGVGGFEFVLLSDSTGAPVNADSISAVDRLGCNNENQVVYLDNFSYLDGTWAVPVFPSQATVGGSLNITASYAGKTYNFAGYYPPVGTDCVTLYVPSGNLTSSTVTNGSGSYCSLPTRSAQQQTSSDTTFTTNFNFWITVNYSGSWRLDYWGQDGLVTQYNESNYNVKGNLAGSGNYTFQVGTYGVGYADNILCANATKLDAQNNLTLTLSIFPPYWDGTGNTTTSDPTATACGMYGV